ncbi:MAG: hypothetical protein AAFY39_09850 [Pseudomonadota bacterium]
MKQRAVLVSMYFGMAMLWQIVLWTALPNVGMGGLAVVWIVWPLLALSGIGVWFLLKSAGPHAVIIFGASVVAMLVATLIAHPQDGMVGLAGKLQALLQ